MRWWSGSWKDVCSAGAFGNFAPAFLALSLLSCADIGKPRRYDRVKYDQWTSEAHYRERRIPDPANPPASDLKLAPSLDPGRPYIREVLESVYVLGRQDPWRETCLLRIHQDGNVIYDASICGLHRRPMKRRIETKAGLLDYAASLRKAKEAAFLNDGVIYDVCGSGLYHMTWECPMCLEKSEKWREAHPSRRQW